MATFTGTTGADSISLANGNVGFTPNDAQAVLDLGDLIGDTFNALAGNDTIHAGGGGDTIIGGAGADHMYGGAGSDAFNFVTGDVVDGEIIVGGTSAGVDIDTDYINIAGAVDFTGATIRGIDVVAFSNLLGATSATFFANQFGLGITAGAVIIGSTAVDTLTINMASSNTLDLAGLNVLSLWAPEDRVVVNLDGADAETVTGTTVADRFVDVNLNDVVNGGAGDDTFVVSAGAPTARVINGGADSDTLELTRSSGYYDFRQTSLTSIERVTIVGSGGTYTDSAFKASQFNTAGQLASNLHFDAGVNTADNIVLVYLEGENGVSLSGLTFSANFGRTKIIGNDDSGIDFISGSRIADEIYGDGGSDSLIGGSGNDTIIGGAGSDGIRGNGGRDISRYTVASTDATRVRNLGSWTVTAGADGTDTLTNIEVLQFTDRKVVIEDPLSDFNADATSDLLWFQQSTGTALIRNMVDNTVTGGVNVSPVGADWTLQTTGDFNGDGSSDFVWKNTTTGQFYLWNYANNTQIGSANLGVIGTNWNIKGSGDFDDDGSGDIVWNNTTDGHVYLWMMRDNAQVASASFGAIGAEWSVAAVGDFNGDGWSDIFLRRSTDGLLYAWSVQNGAIIDGDNYGAIGTNWNVAGSGDFNGDGFDDVLLRDSTNGALYIWNMGDSAAIVGGASLGALGTDWIVDAVSDTNGDFTADILLKNTTTGRFYLYGIQDNAVTTTADLGTLGTDWQLI